MLAVCVALLAALVVGCDSPASTARPSASLIELEFTPLPTSTPTFSASPTAQPSAEAGWPAGWDTAFCTAFTDANVAHELVIDIDRAITDNARSDARGLAKELAQNAPIAGDEIDRIGDWEPAAEVKADLAALIALDEQAAADYLAYFKNNRGADLKAARKARKQIGKAVPATNDHLQQLADLGLACPGSDLQLEAL